MLLLDKTASWQTPPHLLPKRSKSKFRITIDLRPVSAATKTENWPLPHVGSELVGFKDNKYFAALDFFARYWQYPLHLDSYDACGIIAPQSSFTATRVLHRLKNAFAYFQSITLSLFPNIQKNCKEWIGDIIIHAKTKREILSALSECFPYATHIIFVCQHVRVYASKHKLSGVGA